jgi:hypothetical protein
VKRSTWIVLVIFLALAGITFYLGQKESPADESETTPVAPIELLISDSDGLPTSIDIKSAAGEQVTIARNETGLWVLKQPIETEANQGSAQAAATQLTSLRIVSHPAVASDMVGLNPPSYTLTVELTGGTEKVVRIGDRTPTGIGYYANVNSSGDVLIISQDGLDSLLILLESPPYKNTPTP